MASRGYDEIRWAFGESDRLQPHTLNHKIKNNQINKGRDNPKKIKIWRRRIRLGTKIIKIAELVHGSCLKTPPLFIQHSALIGATPCN
jgi:hypothetical protein